MSLFEFLIVLVILINSIFWDLFRRSSKTNSSKPKRIFGTHWYINKKLYSKPSYIHHYDYHYKTFLTELIPYFIGICQSRQYYTVCLRIFSDVIRSPLFHQSPWWEFLYQSLCVFSLFWSKVYDITYIVKWNFFRISKEHHLP